MASVNIDVDLSDDATDVTGGLAFQDIPHSTSDENRHTHTFTEFPDSAVDDDDKKELLSETKKSLPYWSFEYYQTFFDIETRTVLYRILCSMLPRPRKNFLKIGIRPNPDLYGPFWVSTTLIFCIAIVGNLITLFYPDKVYIYRFDKVTYAAAVIYGYWWIIPSLIFLVLWWRGNRINYSFLELICIYGYSLSIYVPVSVICIIPFKVVKWLFTIAGTLLSGSVLVFSFVPLIREESRKVAITMLVLIFVAHTALACGFVLYFFHVPQPALNGNSTEHVLTSLF